MEGKSKSSSFNISFKFCHNTFWALPGSMVKYVMDWIYWHFIMSTFSDSQVMFNKHDCSLVTNASEDS